MPVGLVKDACWAVKGACGALKDACWAVKDASAAVIYRSKDSQRSSICKPPVVLPEAVPGEISAVWVVWTRSSASLTTSLVPELDASLMLSDPYIMLTCIVGSDGERVQRVGEDILCTGSSSIPLLNSGAKSA